MSNDLAIAYVGDRLITATNLIELNRIQLRAKAMHEQMEALAERACVILGVPTDSCSTERDIAEEIVFSAERPMDVINQLNEIIE